MSVAALLALQLFVYGGEAPAYWDWQHTEPYDLSVQVEVLALDPDAFAPCRAAGKDVLAVEYGSAGQDWNAICGRAKAAGIHLILKDEIITAGGRACR